MSESVKTTRRLPSWIDGFVEFCEGLPTPRIFKLWSAIGCVAGALERRTWVTPGPRPIYPNMYILLVATPGIGKTVAITECNHLWQSIEDLHIAPDSMTKAALIDMLHDSGTTTRLPGNKTMTYHSLLIGSGEFGVLVPSWDLALMNTLNNLYDCGKVFREMIRGRPKDQQPPIPNPQLHMIAGTQPNYLATLMPAEAWGLGFPSRCMLIYAGEQETIPLFQQRENDAILESHLVHDLRRISRLYGEFVFDDDAADELSEWYINKMPPQPMHVKLQGYNTRRLEHLSKLCMTVSASRRDDLVITLEDLNLARALLIAAEAEIPEIFKVMTHTDDTSIMDDLYEYVLGRSAISGEPVQDSMLVHFLLGRMPSYKVRGFIDVAKDMRVIKKAGVGLWIPCDRMERVV